MSYDDSTQEVLQRVRRIETRLTRLARALGVSVMDDDSRIIVIKEHPPLLEVNGLDVSFGDVLAFCKKSGINGIVTLNYKGQLLGSTITFKEVERASG